MADSKSVKSAEGLKTGERVSDGEEGEGRMNWEISTDIYTHCVLSRVRLFVTPLTVTP